MKTAKLSVKMLIALIIMLFAFNGYAQDSKSKHTPEERAKKMTDKIRPVLNLTEEQNSKMYELTLDQIKWKKEKKTSTISKTAKKVKREEFKAKEYSILTPEQMVKLKEYKKEHHKSWFRRTFGIF